MAPHINSVGYRWLAEQYNIEPVQPFRIVSQIAGTRSTKYLDGYIHEFYPAGLRPVGTLQGHMTFALKREGVHLEFLARLFAEMPAVEMEQWIVSEPSGQYARRAGFFYEWLTGNLLSFPGVKVGNYVDAMEADQYLTASKPENNTRWRVRDNLPGTRDYSPLVFRTDRVRHAEQYNVAARLRDLAVEYGEDLLMRSAVWLTVKESQASFAIEHEEKQVDRIKRFAAVMERRCGQSDSPLDEAFITELQQEILGPGHRTISSFGLRRSPVFVSENSLTGPVAHYIAPHWDDAPSMLAGLRVFVARTTGKSPLVRAAAISFGFVSVHPTAGGNGRISRFLINDMLRRDGALPAPFILPVSATITSSSANRRSYDQILEIFSKPFMRQYQNQYTFGTDQIAEDGIRYNLRFSAYEDASKAWRYPDLTEHTEYMATIVELTLDQEMRNEARYLRSARAARDEIKNVVEGPDSDIDRIIRSVLGNKGQISNKLKKDFSFLEEPGVGAEIVKIIQTQFHADVTDDVSPHDNFQP